MNDADVRCNQIENDKVLVLEEKDGKEDNENCEDNASGQMPRFFLGPIGPRSRFGHFSFWIRLTLTSSCFLYRRGTPMLDRREDNLELWR